ncbi:MAG: amidohydrolase family protein [Pseudomonadota bacterium]
MESHAEWLAQVHEETLDPSLPIIDPHHHLWDFRKGAVDTRYFIHEFLKDAGTGHNIVASVFIECGTMFNADADPAFAVVGETEFVNGQAAMAASGGYGPTQVAAGIVGTAYLTQGASAGAVLDAQIAAGNGRFRGIRQAASWDASPEVENHRTEPMPDLYADAKFREGFAELAPRGLTFEAWCYHTQIPSLTRLAEAFPDTTIILDHFGGPIGVGPYADQKEAVFERWRESVTALARCPNVYAKLGGLAMEVNGFAWHERVKPPGSAEFMDAQKRYFEFTLEQFGVERCMFESNFPVDKLSVSYHVVWNAFKRLTSNYSADERARLFHGTAAEVYRLEHTLARDDGA